MELPRSRTDDCEPSKACCVVVRMATLFAERLCSHTDDYERLGTCCDGIIGRETHRSCREDIELAVTSIQTLKISFCVCVCVCVLQMGKDLP